MFFVIAEIWLCHFPFIHLKRLTFDYQRAIYTLALSYICQQQCSFIIYMYTCIYTCVLYNTHTHTYIYVHVYIH